LATLALHAPELIFKDPFDSSIDIWAFGCLIYEFLTGTSLLAISRIGDDEDDQADDDHLLDLNDVLQPLPDAWLAKWPHAHRYFGRDRERLDAAAPENGAWTWIMKKMELMSWTRAVKWKRRVG
jgi:serine/threonine protein kinase